MKKTVLIISTILISFSLMAFAYVNWNDSAKDENEMCRGKLAALDNDFAVYFEKPVAPDLIYNIDSRFMTTVSKEKLHMAKSIVDFLPEEATQSLESFDFVTVSLLPDSKETSKTGENEHLNIAQIKLLQSADYSSNFHINANCKKKNAYTGVLENYNLVYYLTIVPEKEATFIDGQEVLIDYLRENSKSETRIITQDHLRPGQIHFTVAKNGTISKVNLSSTSGYVSVDEKLVELIENMPGYWIPATNSIGEKVEQEFVFFFGKQGC